MSLPEVSRHRARGSALHKPVHYLEKPGESSRISKDSGRIPQNPKNPHDFQIIEPSRILKNPEESLRIPGSPRIPRNPKNPESAEKSSRPLMETSYEIFQVSSPSTSGMIGEQFLTSRERESESRIITEEKKDIGR